jgi:hypothetical protein
MAKFREGIDPSRTIAAFNSFSYTRFGYGSTAWGDDGPVYDRDIFLTSSLSMFPPAGEVRRPHSAGLTALQRVADGLIMAATLYGVLCISSRVGCALRPGSRCWGGYFFGLAEALNLYTSWQIVSLLPEIYSVTMAWLATVLLLVGLAFATQLSTQYSPRL